MLWPTFLCLKTTTAQHSTAQHSEQPAGAPSVTVMRAGWSSASVAATAAAVVCEPGPAASAQPGLPATAGGEAPLAPADSSTSFCSTPGDHCRPACAGKEQRRCDLTRWLTMLHRQLQVRQGASEGTCLGLQQVE